MRLSRYGVAFGEHVVLRDVSLELGPGHTTLVGPAGTGKSTLLRSICGLNDAQPAFRSWGRLEGVRRAALVEQKAALLMGTVFDYLVSGLANRSELRPVEQRDRLQRFLVDELELEAELTSEVTSLEPWAMRLLAVGRLALSDADLLCLDEVTTGLEERGAARLLDYVRRLGRRRAILFVTHHQGHARCLGGRVALLANGVVESADDCEAFFGGTEHELVRSFLRTGSCPEKSDDLRVPPSHSAPRARGPLSFHWLLAGVLGGMRRPGLLRPLDEDLAGLRALGVSVLVTLEEQDILPNASLEANQIAGLHFPIDDGEAPTPPQMAGLCHWIDERIEAGGAIAVHCRAGLGRTGCVLASYLVHRGATGMEALQTVRRINPRWVQTQTQVEFLRSLEAHCPDVRMKERV